MRVLEASGYYCMRAGGSLGIFDVLAIGLCDLKCIQVKSGGTYCSTVEREALQLLTLPSWATKEIWRWPDRAKAPLIERVR